MGSNRKLVHPQNKTVQKINTDLQYKSIFDEIIFFNWEQKELSVVTSKGAGHFVSIKLLQLALKVYTINKQAFIKSFYQVGGSLTITH